VLYENNKRETFNLQKRYLEFYADPDAVAEREIEKQYDKYHNALVNYFNK
jgi:hypothetical protein